MICAQIYEIFPRHFNCVAVLQYLENNNTRITSNVTNLMKESDNVVNNFVVGDVAAMDVDANRYCQQRKDIEVPLIFTELWRKLTKASQNHQK